MRDAVLGRSMTTSGVAVGSAHAHPFFIFVPVAGIEPATNAHRESPLPIGLHGIRSFDRLLNAGMPKDMLLGCWIAFYQRGLACVLFEYRALPHLPAAKPVAR